MLSLRDVFSCFTLTIFFGFIHFTAVALTDTIESATSTPQVRPSRPGIDIIKSDEYVDDSLNEDFPETYSECPDCELQKSLTPDKIKALRLEMIKKQILNKLKMKHRPNITLPRDMLPTFLSEAGILNDEADPIAMRKAEYVKKENIDIDDYYGTTTQAIIFAEPGNTRCFHNKRQNPSSCFRFRITKELDKKEITGAQLWVYKLANAKDVRNQTFVINEISGIGKSKTKSRIITTVDTNIKTGWIKFEIKNLINKWMKKIDHTYFLEIVCKTCSTHEHFNSMSNEAKQRPFLVINTAEAPTNNRHKRSSDCMAGISDCCRESFYVSFAMINWNDWIIQPEGYTANYCRGSCRGAISPVYHHTSIMQRVAMSEEDPDRSLILTPCCSPTRMSSISLLYFNEEMRILKKNLPNMVVEACGCS